MRDPFDQASRRSALVLHRGVVKKVSDGPKWQELQVELLSGEIIDGVERPQSFGDTSVPKPGAEVIVSFVGGSRSHPVALVVDDRSYRPTDLPEGTKAIYAPDGSILKIVPDQHAVFDTNEKPQYLGGDPAKGHTFAKVMTESGPSPFVYARIS